jgi:O-antigen ligase
MLSFVILLLIYFIVRQKKRAWLVTFVLFTIVFLTYLLDARRVTTLFDRYGKNVSTALDDRARLWAGVVEAIRLSPVFGAGTGAEQKLINEGYEKVGYTEGIENSYNAHNQYLQFWVRNGLPELSCFLVLLVFLFLRALKLRSLTFLIFLMMVSMIMFTESFLNVQKGIVFFYFFACAFTMIPEEQSLSRIVE